MFQAFVGLNGRLGRAAFWGYSLLLMAFTLLPFMAYVLYSAFDTLGADPNLSDETFQIIYSQHIRGPLVLLTAVTLWPTYALFAKRLQDHDRSGALAIPLMIPGLASVVTLLVAPGTAADQVASAASGLSSLFCLVYLGCIRGTVGPNSYGPDPVRCTDPTPAAA